MDFTQAIEVAPKIYWIGSYLENDPFQCHAYLIENGNESILIDPGSMLEFESLIDKISTITELNNIKYIILHHQDPDLCASVPAIEKLINRDDLQIVTHSRMTVLIKHYLTTSGFYVIDQHDLKLVTHNGLSLDFITTPYCHSPGAFVTYEPESKTLFSSDIFSGLEESWEFYATENYFEQARLFHESYMPGKDIFNYTLRKIEQLDIDLITPQHGSIIKKKYISKLIEDMKNLECGLYIDREYNDELLDVINQLEEVQEIAHFGNWSLDLVENKLSWSNEVFRIFEINHNHFEASYEAFIERVHPDDRALVNQTYTQSVENKTIYYIEHRLLMEDGRIKYVQERGKSTYDENGKPLRSVGTIYDITKLKQTENALQKSNDKFRALVETTQDFIWEVTADAIYTYCSPQIINILGYRPEEMLGKRPFDFMPENEAKRVSEFFKNTHAQQAIIEEFENINFTKDGHEVILETSGQPFFSIRGELLGYRGIDRDITRRKQAERKLRHMAHHDSLTGLANRRQLIIDFQQESKRASRFNRKLALFYLDLNRFKIVNDELGHDVGDALLQFTAEKIDHLLRETENIYRVGGDEFCILIPEFNNKEQLKVLAGRIIENISSIEHFGETETEIDIGCSIGIAIYPEDGKVLADLTSVADRAMYHAKTSQHKYFSFVN